MKLFDFDHPSFKPLWVRVAVVVSCIAWGVFEFVTGAPFWGVLFTGIGAISAWRFSTIDDGNGDDG